MRCEERVERGCYVGSAIPPGRADRAFAGWLPLVSALFALCLAAAAGKARGAEWYVDPIAGVDASGRGVDPAFPARTVSFVLRESVDEAITVELAPGTYCGGAHEAESSEVFPLPPARNARRLTLRGPRHGGVAMGDQGAGAAVFEPLDPELTVIRVAPSLEDAAGAGLRELVLEGVHFRGGKVGVTVAPVKADVPAGAGPSGLRVAVRDCRFDGTAGNALQFFATEGWSCEYQVTRTTVENCGGGVAHEAAENADLRSLVAECRILDLPVLLPGVILGGAIDYHVDGGADLRAVCERNSIRNPGVAFSLSASGPQTAPARLAVTLRNNVVYFDPSRGCAGAEGADAGFQCGLAAAVHLFLWPSHALEIDVVNNTFWGVERYGFYVDNEALLSGFDDRIVPLVARNNIFWHEFGASEELLARLANSGEGLPQGLVFEANIVPSVWLAVAGPGGNQAIDPRFEATPDGRFDLGADSPAIDTGTDAVRGVVGDVDFAGRCRIAAASPVPADARARIDRGALERRGTCERDLAAVFRRADCNADAAVDIADPLRAFGFLFLGDAAPRCFDACDANDDGALDIADGIYTLGALFLGSPAPPPPFPAPGLDPTPDALPDCG
jgi:hypothetical protein